MSKVSICKETFSSLAEYIYQDQRFDFVERLENGGEDFLGDGAFFECMGFMDMSDEGVDALTAFVQQQATDDVEDVVDWLAFNGNSGHIFSLAVKLMVEAGISKTPKLSKELVRKMREVAYANA
jgi:hypothetical protein